MAGIDGSGGPVYAQGPIEAFGSIVVNGRHYDISSASIRVNGEVATEDDLALGQIVAVQGFIETDDSRVADSVEFESNLRGPIQAIDAVNGMLIVLEQPTSVGSETTIDAEAGDTLDDLAVGDYVEVSGLFNADGELVATRIEQVDSSSELRIIGRVEMVDLGAFTFSIGDLVVDYSGALLIEGFEEGAPENGDVVLVVGSGLDIAGALTAARLANIDSDESEYGGDEAEVEGLITRFVSTTDFDVAGKRATTTNTTTYEGGSAADLQLNVKIQIEGEFDGSGTIVADKIEVKDGGRVY
jgi:Domain of unknown function (DUF5666)